MRRQHSMWILARWPDSSACGGASKETRAGRVKPLWHFDGTFGTSFDLTHPLTIMGPSWVLKLKKMTSFILRQWNLNYKKGKFEVIAGNGGLSQRFTLDNVWDARTVGKGNDHAHEMRTQSLRLRTSQRAQLLAEYEERLLRIGFIGEKSPYRATTNYDRLKI